MDSLYGGHQGISFVLKASYPSVAQMVAAFKGGANYTAVWYGEFVLIDTPNKNDADNGKVYRRGLDYQNNMGGAEYIGQIVGPSSGTPYFQLDDLDEVKEKAQEAIDELTWKKYPTGRDEDGKYIVSTNGDGSDIGEFAFGRTNALVPGKQGEQFNDDIKYTWVNIRKDNADADSWFYVGFEIPYLVIDYQVNSASPYNDLGNRVDLATIERIDNYTHPFYEEWRLNVPKGVKGDTLSNLRVIVPQAQDIIYDIDNITTSVDLSTGKFTTTLGKPGYDGQQDDITGGRAILVFDYSYYDDTAQGTTVTVYVADYNLVRAVNLDDDGTLRLEMTHEDEVVFEKKIRWIDLISLTNGNGQDGGHFTFRYNNDNPRQIDEFDISWIKGLEIDDDGSIIYTYAGTPDSLPEGNRRIAEGVYRVEDFLQWISAVSLNSDTGEFTVTNNRSETIYSTVLDWIKSIQLDQDGTLHLRHTKDNRDEQLVHAIKWVTDVDLNLQTGIFQINFNYGDPLTVQLDWINDLYIDEATGEIAVHHISDAHNTDTTAGGQKGKILDAKLKIIVKAQIGSDGTIDFITNTGNVISLQNAGFEGGAFRFKTLDDVRLQTPIAADKHIQVKYSTDVTYQNIGNPINYIQDMVVRNTDFHLLVLYNDPTHRPTAEQLDEQGKWHGYSWIADIQGSDGSNYGPSVYWQDLGTIKDQSGLLIGFNVTEDKITGSLFDDIISYLNGTYPDGLTEEQNERGGLPLKGKIVTYSKDVGDSKEYYAFDYNAHSWYYLGKLEDSGDMRDARAILTPYSGAQRQEMIQKLTTSGLLFTIDTQVTSSDTNIPRYWSWDYNQWT